MNALLLAGGLGTRLRPLTEDLPKPMAPLGNRPWLFHLIQHLREEGIRDIVIALKHYPDVVIKYFGDGHRFGVNIRYVLESQLLGTAGAIKNAEAYLDDTFIVLNADVVHTTRLLPLLDFHQKHGGLVTIGLTEVEDPSAYGVVQLSEKAEIVCFVEKPAREEAPSNLINAGIYIMQREALKFIPAQREVSIEKETFPLLIEKGLGVYGAPIQGYWMDMGTQERYRQVHWDLLDGKILLPYISSLHRMSSLELSLKEKSLFRGSSIDFLSEACISGQPSQHSLQLPVSQRQKEFSTVIHARDDESEGAIYLDAMVQIGKNVKIIPPVLIGKGAVLEEGCVIGPYVVIGENTRIGKNSSCKHTIIWQDTEIAPGAYMENCILGDHLVTSPNQFIHSAVIKLNQMVKQSLQAKTIQKRNEGVADV